MTADQVDGGSKIPALVLAGAPADPDMEAMYAIKYRAELPVAGKAMVRYVIEALNASARVGDVCLVGNNEYDGVSKTVRPAGSIMDNLLAGMKACGGGSVLVVTSDIPLVTAEAMDDFVERCGDRDADFYYPIVSRADCERRFPGMRRTYVRMAEDTFTGGNIMIIRSEFLIGNAGIIGEALNARKSPMRLASMIGSRVLVRALIAQCVWPGAIDLALLEKTASRILKGRLQAVRTPYPEIGADVDRGEHLAAIEQILVAKAGNRNA
jgi:hypothetical protein